MVLVSLGLVLVTPNFDLASGNPRPCSGRSFPAPAVRPAVAESQPSNSGQIGPVQRRSEPYGSRPVPAASRSANCRRYPLSTESGWPCWASSAPAWRWNLFVASLAVVKGPPAALVFAPGAVYGSPSPGCCSMRRWGADVPRRCPDHPPPPCCRRASVQGQENRSRRRAEGDPGRA